MRISLVHANETIVPRHLSYHTHFCMTVDVKNIKGVLAGNSVCQDLFLKGNLESQLSGGLTLTRAAWHVLNSITWRRLEWKKCDLFRTSLFVINTSDAGLTLTIKIHNLS